MNFFLLGIQVGSNCLCPIFQFLRLMSCMSSFCGPSQTGSMAPSISPWVRYFSHHCHQITGEQLRGCFLLPMVWASSPSQCESRSSSSVGSYWLTPLVARNTDRARPVLCCLYTTPLSILSMISAHQMVTSTFEAGFPLVHPPQMSLET